MRSIILSMVLLAMPVMAQEVPEPKIVHISNGILCDTEEEVQTFLTLLAIHGRIVGEEVPSGCGMFKPPMPLPVMATPKYWYETPQANSLVTHFRFLVNGWEQWGWVSYIPNQDYEAPTKDEGA